MVLFKVSTLQGLTVCCSDFVKVSQDAKDSRVSDVWPLIMGRRGVILLVMAYTDLTSAGQEGRGWRRKMKRPEEVTSSPVMSVLELKGHWELTRHKVGLTTVS